jgi:hypothetical protein
MLAKRIVPKHEFDCEYMTQWRKEVNFLFERGIHYTIVKKVGDYKIPRYKYKKTHELFLALAEFYGDRHEGQTKEEKNEDDS